MTLKFPLSGKENRPIYDADGKLVSITEHASLFTAAANLVWEIDAAKLGSVADPDKYLHAIILSARKIMEQK